MIELPGSKVKGKENESRWWHTYTRSTALHPSCSIARLYFIRQNATVTHRDDVTVCMHKVHVTTAAQRRLSIHTSLYEQFLARCKCAWWAQTTCYTGTAQRALCPSINARLNQSVCELNLYQEFNQLNVLSFAFALTFSNVQTFDSSNVRIAQASVAVRTVCTKSLPTIRLSLSLSLSHALTAQIVRRVPLFSSTTFTMKSAGNKPRSMCVCDFLARFVEKLSQKRAAQLVECDVWQTKCSIYWLLYKTYKKGEEWNFCYYSRLSFWVKAPLCSQSSAR